MDLTRRTLVKVPEITALFWITKLLTTAMGESTSDYLVNAVSPVAAVAVGTLVLLGVVTFQIRQDRYIPWVYWLAVLLVAIVGTMAADVLHKQFGVPYAASSVFFAVVLAAAFLAWYRVEGTLSIHSIDTVRRELFYWVAVMATFAMGTALGDYTASTLDLGYLASAFLFAGLLLIPAIGFRWLRMNEVLAFWFRVHPHEAARRLHRRLAGQAQGPEWRRAGRRPGQCGLRGAHRGLRGADDAVVAADARGRGATGDLTGPAD